MLPSWIVVFLLFAVGSASGTVALYPTVAWRVAAADAVNSSPILVAMYGRIYDPTSLGALSMLKASVLGSVMVAVFAISIVVRHTRTEEESGRVEMVHSAVVGRLAPLAAALLVAILASGVLGVLTAGGLIAAGLPVAGSIAFGLSWALTGVVFATVAGLGAQFARTGRSTVGLCLAVLGVSFLLRALADTNASFASLRWVSPSGQLQQIRPYQGDNFAVALLPLLVALVIGVLAFNRAASRDLGTGLWSDRPGPASASAGLRGPYGLAWNLQRGSLIIWACWLVIFGAILGNIASSVNGFFDSQQVRDYFARLGGSAAITDAFLATEMAFVGLLVAAFAIQSTQRLHAEEASDRLEIVLSGSVKRWRWTMSHVVIAFGGSVLLALAAGLAAGLANAQATADSAQIGGIVAGALAQLPAVWVILGVALLLFGWLPKWTVAAWAVLVGCVMLGELGPLFKFPQSVLDISPFVHVPKLPGAPFDAVPLLILIAAATAFCIVGVIGFCRRDIL